ncbi:MAG: hypothetical protein IJO50_03320 [Clostridia bacterium]|nr:hypothetical protein [Clostridia bacterium]
MKQKKKIWLYVVCVVLLVLFIVAGLLIHRHWNSIEAVYYSFTQKESPEEVEQKLMENQQNLQEMLDANEDVTVRDLTAEESAALKEGGLSEEEVVKLLTGQESSTPTPAPPAKVPASRKPAKTPEPKPTEKPSGQVIAEAVAKLYVQKNIFIGKLDDIEAYVRNIYINEMTKEQKKTAKKDLLAKHLPEVAAWEKECDAKVYAIIDEIRAELKKSGQSQELADQIEAAYLNEKRLKKSYFINRYMD